MIGVWLLVMGVLLIGMAVLDKVADWLERRQDRELNARFRENQRLWRHG